MAGNIKDIYTQVFNDVYPKIKDLEGGILYNTIQIILMEEHSPARTLTQTWQICNELGIKDRASKNDDYEIVADLAQALFIDRQFLSDHIPAKELISDSLIKLNQFFKSEGDKMKWIILTGCALVGIYFCIKYLNRYKAGNTAMQQTYSDRYTPPSSPPPPIPAALCLVVPAQTVSELGISNGSDLNIDNIKYLFEKTSYFICTTLKKANLNEQNLQLTDEYILADSPREVYIKIEIDDGRELIDNNLPYRLKTNLPTQSRYIVKQLSCLGNLSGLEVFNRI